MLIQIGQSSAEASFGFSLIYDELDKHIYSMMYRIKRYIVNIPVRDHVCASPIENTIISLTP